MSRPNLLYLLSDQHTASVMGCAGDPVADTPTWTGAPPPGGPGAAPLVPDPQMCRLDS